MPSTPAPVANTASPTEIRGPSTPDTPASCRDDAPVSVEQRPDGVPIVCAGSHVAWGAVVEALDHLKQVGSDRFMGRLLAMRRDLGG